MSSTPGSQLDEAHRQQLLDFFLDYLYKIAQERDVNRLLEKLADTIRDLGIAERCTVWVLDQARHEILTKVAHEIRPLRLPMTQGLIGHAVSHGAPVIANDAYQDPRFLREVDEITGFHTRNMVVLPIFDGQMEVIGAFQALNKPADRDFDKADLSVLSVITLLLSKLLDNIENQGFINAIFGYVSRIAHERDLNRVLQILDDMGRSMINCDRCTIWMLDTVHNRLWTKVAHGVDTLTVPADSGLVGYATRTGEVVIIDDAYADERFNPEVDRHTGYQTHSMLVMPVHASDGRAIGAFQAVNKLGPAGRFHPRDVEVLRLSATFAGQTLESLLLQQELDDTQREVIYRLGEIAEMRSKETGNHVKRVAEYSRLLALHGGLGEAEAETLKLASPMHDVGKIAIPDQILNKPGRHTPEEFEIMKTHAQIGHDMLQHSQRPILQAAAIVAGEHHEKFDGSGYPQGTQGEAIHIYGRITAVADVFDALGSDRCYKKAWPLEKILALLREQSGRHFDPRLIQVFFDHLDEFLHIRDQYRDQWHTPSEAAEVEAHR